MTYSSVSCSPAFCSVGGFLLGGRGGEGGERGERELFTANVCHGVVAVSVLAWSRML